jgi:hypothetical protein
MNDSMDKSLKRTTVLGIGDWSASLWSKFRIGIGSLALIRILTTRTVDGCILECTNARAHWAHRFYERASFIGKGCIGACGEALISILATKTIDW